MVILGIVFLWKVLLETLLQLIKEDKSIRKSRAFARDSMHVSFVVPYEIYFARDLHVLSQFEAPIETLHDDAEEIRISWSHLF